jgi:transcriptional regulator with XRE-family HTH domain
LVDKRHNIFCHNVQVSKPVGLVRKKPRVETWLEHDGERLGFSAWLDEQRRARGLSKSALGAALGVGYVADGGSSSVNRYLERGAVPKPETMRHLNEALRIPWLEVVARAGYYRELVRIFDDLVWLGDKWLEEDDARGGTLSRDGSKASRLLSLRDAGVVYWNGNPITANLLKSPAFLNRYCVGSWRVPEREVGRVEYPWIEQEGSTGVLVPDMSQPPIRYETFVEPPRSVPTALPKPIALAIMLIILILPRRGDVYKKEALEYAQALYPSTDAMIGEAAARRAESKTVGRPKRLHSFLQRTSEVLGDPELAFDARRFTAAEHTAAWASAICRPFTDYARLAALRRPAEAGAPLSSLPAFIGLPAHYSAELPPIEALTTYS